MEEQHEAKYKTLLLLGAGIFAVWGILGVFDVGQMPYSGYGTDGNNTVIRIEEGSPAEQAGFQTGDYIRSIGGIAVEDAAARARSPRPRIGERRTYIVEREGEQASLDLTYASLPTSNRATTLATILIGFGFLIFGLIPYLRAPNQRTLLLAVVGLCLGLSFFNGPYVSSYALRTFVFSVFSLFFPFGFAALLHFALVFPKRKAVLDKAWVRRLIYAPALLLIVFFLYRGLFQPPTTSVMNTITGILLGLFILGYFGLAVVAMIHSYVRADKQERTRQGLPYLLWGSLVGLVPIIVMSLVRLVAPQVVIPGSNFVFLTIILIPISFALAASRREKSLATDANAVHGYPQTKAA